MKHQKTKGKFAAPSGQTHALGCTTGEAEYVASVLSLRKQKMLHTVVERRLVSLVGQITPQLHPVPEIQGLAGGRNDLMLFEFNGDKVVFEIFATKSQVSRDLRILDNTDADEKIAIIIDCNGSA